MSTITSEALPTDTIERIAANSQNAGFVHMIDILDRKEVLSMCEEILLARKSLASPVGEAKPVAVRCWRWASTDEWHMLSSYTTDASLADFVRDQEKIAPVVVQTFYTSPPSLRAETIETGGLADLLDTFDHDVHDCIGALINAIQWLENIKAGTSTVDEANANMREVTDKLVWRWEATHKPKFDAISRLRSLASDAKGRTGV